MEIDPYENIDLRASTYKLPFKSEIFDNVLLIEILEHLKEPKNAIKEISRVLRKNGKLIFIKISKSRLN